MAEPQTRYTPAQYLARERAAPTKSEYVDGQIFAMAGASRRHNLITTNIVIALGAQLREQPCEVYSSDMRVKVAATGLYTYPDVVAVCTDPQFEDEELDTLVNPTLLVEVLSKSTADYDRGDKFEHYRTIPALREVLFVAQDHLHLVHYQRHSDQSWLLSETRDPEGRRLLPSLPAEIVMAEVYAKVRFNATTGSAASPVP